MNEKALQLLDQIIEKEQEKDKVNALKDMKDNRASQAVGEGWTLWHLKALKQLLTSSK